MNAEEMEKLRKIRETEPGALGLQRSDSRCSNSSKSSQMSKSTTSVSTKDEEVVSQDFPDDDLKTPTVEELSFPGQKVSKIRKVSFSNQNVESKGKIFYSYLKKSLNATKQKLHKHVSRKMLSVPTT